MLKILKKDIFLQSPNSTSAENCRKFCEKVFLLNFVLMLSKSAGSQQSRLILRMEDDSASYIFNDCLIGGASRSMDSSDLTLSDLYFDLLTSRPDLDDFHLPLPNEYSNCSPDSSESSATCPEVFSVDSSACKSTEGVNSVRDLQAKKDHCYIGLYDRHAEEKSTSHAEYETPPALLPNEIALTEQLLLADDDVSISAAKFLTVGTSKSESSDFSSEEGFLRKIYTQPTNSAYFPSTPEQYGSDFSSSSPNSSCTGMILIEDAYTDADSNIHENFDGFSIGSADTNFFEISRGGQTLYKSIDSESSRYRSKMQDLALRHKLITNQNLKTCGQLMLSTEERRTLVQEGYSIPTSLPLSRKEEEALKMVRRKIKNKLSAQESRRRRKEYTDELERSMRKCQSENHSLRAKVDGLEEQNQTLIGELKRLQAMVGHKSQVDKNSSAPGITGVTLTVTFLLFAFLLPSFPAWTRLPLHAFNSNENLSKQIQVSTNDDPLANHVYETAKNAPIPLHPPEADCSYSSQWFLFDQSKRSQSLSCPVPVSRLLVEFVATTNQKTDSDELSAYYGNGKGELEKSRENSEGFELMSTNGGKSAMIHDANDFVEINKIVRHEKSSNSVKEFELHPTNQIGHELVGGVLYDAAIRDDINESSKVISHKTCDSLCLEQTKSRLLFA